MSTLRAIVVRVGLALGAWLLGALPAVSDPETAQAALGAGRSALGRKDWAAAKAQFQRALDEDPTLLEAQLGLGEAQAGGGDREQAARSLRALLLTIEELKERSEEQVALYSRARKRLPQLGGEDAALDLLVRKHADLLASLSSKWASKDPGVAAEAAQAALRLAPDHAKATDLRARAAQAGSRKPIAIFNGRDGVGFEPLTKEWRVEDGLLIGDVTEGAYLLPSQERWAGDFDILMEASIVEAYTANGPPFLAVMGGFVDRDHHLRLGCLRTGILWRETFGPTEAETRDLADVPLARIDPKLTPKSWITYEMRFRGKHVIALVAGKEIGRAPRPKERPECQVVLTVQCCKAAIRRLEITPR